MNKKIVGGDGYSIDVNNSIGGLPSFARYSNNYKPVFDGELLAGGGCSCVKNLIQGGSKKSLCKCSKMQTCKKCKSSKMKKGGACAACSKIQMGGECACSKMQMQTGGDYIDDEKYIIDIILQQGGKQSNITQFSAIKEVSNKLRTLEKKSLSKLSLDVIINELVTKNPKKSATFNKNMKYLQKKLLSFDKNNLTILSSLLLLHHCARDSEKKDKQSGGDSGVISSSLSSILAPLGGVNAFGTAVFLIFLQKSFMECVNKKKDSEKKGMKTVKKLKKQSGGNPLKNLIAPLGTSAFICTAILVLLERILTNVIREKKSKTLEKKKMYGGRINKKINEITNILSPISFNAFAKESFLQNLNNNTLSKK